MINHKLLFSGVCLFEKNLDKQGNLCKKDRVVVDIRGSNGIINRDAYPIPTQSDIIAAITGCHFNQTVVCASFFYRWKVKEEDQNSLTVATHSVQETCRCAVMGFRNFAAYVQRRIDTILRSERPFAWAYIDEIVIFIRIFEENIEPLKSGFQKLKIFKIVLGIREYFLDYFAVELLGQRVDAVGLASADD